MKDQFKEIVGLLRQSELRRKEAEKELKLREQAIATSLVRLCHVLSIFQYT
jgi:kinesin family protein 4/21/27